jgi:hypothetical protein
LIEMLHSIALRIADVASHVEAPINPQGRPLGLIVVGIIELPVLILFLAALLGKPRSTKITSLFVGWVFLMFGAFIGAVYFLSYVLGVFY